MIKIVILQSLSILFLFSESISQTPGSSKSNKSTSIDMEKWTKATINIECESGTEITFKQLDSLEKVGRITKHLSDSVKKIAFTNPLRASGTAIFLKYNDHHFLISARHVLLDYQAIDSNALAKKIMLVENKGSSLNDITGITISGTANKGVTVNFNENAEISFLFSFEGIGWKDPDSLGFRRASYVFSSVYEDLAILDLEE